MLYKLCCLESAIDPPLLPTPRPQKKSKVKAGSHIGLISYKIIYFIWTEHLAQSHEMVRILKLLYDTL